MSSKLLNPKLQKKRSEKLHKLYLDSYSKPTFKVMSLARELIKDRILSGSCGDKLSISFEFNSEDKLVSLSYSGEGCVIFLATVELLCRLIYNRTRAEGKLVIQEFEKLITQQKFNPDILGHLALLIGSPALHTRTFCFRLAYKMAEKVLEEK